MPAKPQGLSRRLRIVQSPSGCPDGQDADAAAGAAREAASECSWRCTGKTIATLDEHEPCTCDLCAVKSNEESTAELTLASTQLQL